jgi:hypothetical protein
VIIVWKLSSDSRRPCAISACEPRTEDDGGQGRRRGRACAQACCRLRLSAHLVGRVLRVPAGVLQDVAQDDGGHVRAVVAHAQVRLEHLVLLRHRPASRGEAGGEGARV